jgi:uncharacterized protein YecE (DUF72 family)
MKALRIGCSGWSYKDWRGSFYPEGLAQRRWLAEYAEHFPTVEVNSTFYRLPKREVMAGWAEQTPAGFEFAVKGSRYLTHVKRLDLTYTRGGIEPFWEPLEPLREADKLGPVLWQLPANFHRDDERLAGFIGALPQARHCFEFRHASWFCPAVKSILGAGSCSLVVAHDARTELPVPSPSGPMAYVRFHYGERGRQGNYSKTEIAVWRQRLAAWRRSRDVYAYFNNDWKAYAPRDARELAAGAG